MRLLRIVLLGLLSVLACGCTTRIELGTPVLAIYKHSRIGGTISLDSAIQIFYNGRINFLHREARTGRPLERTVRMQMDSLRLLLGVADSLDFFQRDPDHRSEPFRPSGLTLDFEDAKTMLPEYTIWMYQNEYRQHGVDIHSNSPVDLRAFGELIKSMSASAQRR